MGPMGGPGNGPHGAPKGPRGPGNGPHGAPRAPEGGAEGVVVIGRVGAEGGGCYWQGLRLKGWLLLAGFGAGGVVVIGRG